MSEKNNYIYRFLDINNKIIYIGKTTDLLQRIKNHSHLPSECYKSIKSISYIILSTELEMDILELLLINYYQPLYNSLSKYENNDLVQLNYYLKCFDLKNKEWFELNKIFFEDIGKKDKNFKIQKDEKQKLSKEQIKIKQKIGIEKAKKDGKFKGKKQITLNEEEFLILYKRWKNKEISAKFCYDTLKISSNTFYRRIKQYEQEGIINKK